MSRNLFSIKKKKKKKKKNACEKSRKQNLENPKTNEILWVIYERLKNETGNEWIGFLWIRVLSSWIEFEYIYGDADEIKNRRDGMLITSIGWWWPRHLLQMIHSSVAIRHNQRLVWVVTVMAHHHVHVSASHLLLTKTKNKSKPKLVWYEETLAIAIADCVYATRINYLACDANQIN